MAQLDVADIVNGADEVIDALRVIVLDARTRSWLRKNDPESLRQAEAALANVQDGREPVRTDVFAPFESCPAETAAVGRRLGHVIETLSGVRFRMISLRPRRQPCDGRLMVDLEIETGRTQTVSLEHIWASVLLRGAHPTDLTYKDIDVKANQTYLAAIANLLYDDLLFGR
jgi:hypothetical protein